MAGFEVATHGRFWVAAEVEMTSLLKMDFRLLSVYRRRDGTKIGAIMEADRSSTTLLLPSEY